MEINAYGTIMFLMALIATRLIVLNLAYLQVNAFRVQVGLTEFRPEGLIVQHLTTL